MNTLSVMKDTLNEINSRVVTEEEKVSEFKDINGNHSKQKCREGKKNEPK